MLAPRQLLMASFAVSLLVFLPTLNFLAPREPDRYWLPNSMLRVFPALIAFVCLARYAAALGWPAVRRWARRWYAVRNTSPQRRQGTDPQHRQGLALGNPSLGLRASAGMGRLVESVRRACGAGLISGAVAAAAFGIVLLAAFETSPTRIWKTPDNWTRLDWIVHGEEMLRMGGLTPKMLGTIHRELGRCYVPLDRDAALEHYLSAVNARHDPNTAVEMGDLLVRFGRYAEAQRCYCEVAKADPDNPTLRKRLTTVDRLIARQKASE
jgi:tetratricopeptide (TPR) repeat protein